MTLPPLPSDSVHLAWILSPLLRYEPLLVVTRLQTIYILKVDTLEPYAYLTGHGGVSMLSYILRLE